MKSASVIRQKMPCFEKSIVSVDGGNDFIPVAANGCGKPHPDGWLIVHNENGCLLFFHENHLLSGQAGMA